MRFKYLIDEKLNNIPKKEYDGQINRLINLLDVSRSTFHDWRRLTIEDKRDVPVSALVIIAHSLNCSIMELINYQADELIERRKEELIRKHKA